MKKIFALLTMLILLVSFVPMVTASEYEDVNDSIEEGSIENESNDSSVGEREENRYEERERRNEEWKEKREQIKQRIEKVKEDIKEIRTQIKECKESGNCEDLKIKFRQESKDFLSKLVDKTLTNLNKVSERVQESKILNEDAKEQILSDITTNIAEVELIKTEIEAMSETPTKEEIKEVALKLKQIIRQVNEETKISVGMLINSKLGNLIEKSENMNIKLERLVSRYAELGGNLTDIEKNKIKFMEYTVEARSEYELALQAFTSAHQTKDIEARQNFISEAKDHQEKAKNALQNAKKELREIVKKLNEFKEQGVYSA